MENILKVDLAASTAPIVSEQASKEWIEYGTEEWRNLYPQFLIDLYYNSSTQAAIINATSEMVAGEDLVIDDEEEGNLDKILKLKKFMQNANSNESLMEVVKKISFDFKLQGAFALNIVWSADRTQISEIFHIPVEKIRACRPNEFGRVDGYYISGDWSNTRKNRPYYVPSFSSKDRTQANQILYTGLYSPAMSVYHTPDYVAANNWALVDQRVAEYHLSNISSGFSGSYFISFANGTPTQEERMKIESSLAKKFTGAHNSGKFVLTFSDDKTRTPEITPISMSDADKQYLALQELLVQNILTGHRCTSPVLMGIKSDTGLGNNADELNSAANYYLNTVVKPYQEHILKTLQKIFAINEMDVPISFVQLKPITTRFTNQDLMAVMTQDEIREELGLPPLEERVDVDLKKEKKCNHLKAENIELKEWIEKTGEDIPEDWTEIDEEIVDGEHLHFDFEEELNKIANEKIQLAEVPENSPNKKSSQDGVNRSFNDYYKVRYVYATDNFLVNKSGTSREFCQMMVAANKLFRKEDLVMKQRMKVKGRMEDVGVDSNEVNPGFGHDGEPYSIFLYKGGPQCRHFFLRKIFKTSLRNAKQPIEDSQVIGYTKAVSEGFTAKRNDKLVAIAPQRMENHGYYPEND
tara:strand:- start:670 stop:2583 length:1914 start_codon:yes stop_codon:yes gene_type:complete